MSRPTLKQIHDFGLEIVNKDVYHYCKKMDKDYIQVIKSKRYPKKIVIYVCKFYYGYSNEEISEQFGITKNGVSSYTSLIKKNSRDKDVAEELFSSLEYIHSDYIKYLKNKKMQYLKRLNKRSPYRITKSKLTNVEGWLIDKLYEAENKIQKITQ